jgi:hypothetical protein
VVSAAKVPKRPELFAVDGFDADDRGDDLGRHAEALLRPWRVARLQCFA